MRRSLLLLALLARRDAEIPGVALDEKRRPVVVVRAKWEQERAEEERDRFHGGKHDAGGGDSAKITELLQPNTRRRIVPA